MSRIAFGLVFLLLTGAAAPAQTLSEDAKALLGTWEFSNADRDKTCDVTFKAERAASGYRLTFDPKCAEDFPLLREVAGWTYSDNELLHFVDASGKRLVEFSEVEAGMYEAPTPGYGVLFLQNAAEAAAEPVPIDEVTGDWTLMRGGRSLCTLTLTANPADEGFALAVKPGCDAAIARLGFANWRIDRDELLIAPARGTVWRFEPSDDEGWQRVPETANPYRLMRP
jgi:hypothetical protein